MPITQGTALGQNQDGRLELMITVDTGSSDPQRSGSVWHVREVSEDPGWPARWRSLGVALESGFGGPAPAIARNKEERLEIAVTTADALLHIWQTEPNGDEWHHDSLGRPAGQVLTRVSPGLAQNEDGHLQAFVLAHSDSEAPHLNDGQLWAIRQDPTAPDGWSGWTELGTPQVGLTGQPMVARNKDGRLEVFMLGADGAVWHIWQDPAVADGWSPPRWHSLQGQGGPFSELAAGAHADGRLVVFAVAASASPQEANAIWQRGQLLAGGWSAWRPFTRPDGSPTVRDPALALDANKQLQLWLGTKGSGRLYQLKQTAPNSAEWNQQEWDFQSPSSTDSANEPEPADG